MSGWAQWLFGRGTAAAAAPAAAGAEAPEAPGPLSSAPVEPMDLMCPISACLFRDPVMLVSGHTFERASIVEFWRRRPLANPLGTGERLRSAQMIVNYGYRSQVDAWLQRHPDYTPEGWSSRGGVHRCTQEVRVIAPCRACHTLYTCSASDCQPLLASGAARRSCAAAVPS